MTQCVPENRKVCWHFFSGPISRSDDYSFLEDCACKCLHGNKTTEYQPAQYSKVSLLLGTQSSRVLEERTRDFEISLQNFHLHQVRKTTILALPYLALEAWFPGRVSKMEYDVTGNNLQVTAFIPSRSRSTSVYFSAGTAIHIFLIIFQECCAQYADCRPNSLSFQNAYFLIRFPN